jgi:hypothetical protein
MTTDAPIVEALERYAAARGITRGSREWGELVAGYRRNPTVFAELLEKELARIRCAAGSLEK